MKRVVSALILLGLLGTLSGCVVAAAGVGAAAGNATPCGEHIIHA